MKILNCEPCPKGHKVKKPCTRTTKAECEECPPKTFMDEPNATPECYRCASCKRKETVRQECNSTTNTKCKCPPNMVYNRYKPCKSCPKGTKFSNNECIKNEDRNTTQKPLLDGRQTALVISIPLFVIILAVIIVYAWFKYYRRQRKKEKRHLVKGRTHEQDPLKKPPTLEPDKNNVYIPVPVSPLCPSVTALPLHSQPSKSTRISPEDFPYQLVTEMSEMLSLAYSRNYKSLAAALGYTTVFIRNLPYRTDPVESLIFDYLSRENPTKEELVSALKSISRNDVAAKVNQQL